MGVAVVSPFGSLLRQWRAARRMSQLDLALCADVSSRHVSFMETGKSRPSREMVLHLSGALEVPLRERNALLQAAGYAPVYRETDLAAPEMASVREALALLLEQHQPLPAVATDRHWDVVMANGPYLAALAAVVGGDLGRPLEVLAPPRPNVLRLLFAGDGFRSQVLNWEEVAAAVLARVHREALWSADATALALYDELQQTPGAPPRSAWFRPGAGPPALVIPVVVTSPAGPIRYFTTLTTLGAAQDVTLGELRIEAYHPADPESDRRARSLTP